MLVLYILLTVPSLNLLGRLYYIVADTTDNKCEIYDPQTNREGKNFYTKNSILSWAGSVKCFNLQSQDV